MIFMGCGSVAVNKVYGSVSFPGICVVWGLIVMVMVYSVGHISGAHFNPAVTITFAIYRHFPLKQVGFNFFSPILSSTACLLQTRSLRSLMQRQNTNWESFTVNFNLGNILHCIYETSQKKDFGIKVGVECLRDY